MAKYGTTSLWFVLASYRSEHLVRVHARDGMVFLADRTSYPFYNTLPQSVSSILSSARLSVLR
jgi:hypothetical protein